MVLLSSHPFGIRCLTGHGGADYRVLKEKKTVIEQPRGCPVGGGGTTLMGFGAKSHKLIFPIKRILMR
jgi:hypothetical protein